MMQIFAHSPPISYEKIAVNPLYRQLIRYRKCLGFGLTLILMGFYFLAFYLVSYHQKWVITPILSSSVITNGIVYCSFVIVLSFVMTGIYMVLAKKMDALVEQIIAQS